MSGRSHPLELVVERHDVNSDIARDLISALNAELLRQYPEPGATHFRLDAEEVAEGEGAFLRQRPSRCTNGTVSPGSPRLASMSPLR